MLGSLKASRTFDTFMGFEEADLGPGVRVRQSPFGGGFVLAQLP